MRAEKESSGRWPGFVFATPRHAYQYADHDDTTAAGYSERYGRWCDAGGCFEVCCSVCQHELSAVADSMTQHALF